MLDEKNQTLEMRGFEFAVDAVERMGYGVTDSRALEIALEFENVRSPGRAFGVLRLGYAPNKQMKFALILRKISRNLFTDKSMFLRRDLQIPIDRVVIGDRDEVHSFRAELTVELLGIRITVGKIEPPKEPFFRARAEARMDVEIAAAHGSSVRCRGGCVFPRPNRDKL